MLSGFKIMYLTDFYIYSIAILMIVGYYFFRKQYKIHRLFFVAPFVLLLTLIIISKHPSVRYMMPYILLCGFMIFLFVDFIINNYKQYNKFLFVYIICFSILSILLIKSSYKNRKVWTEVMVDKIIDYSVNVPKVFDKYKECAQIHYFRSFEPYYGIDLAIYYFHKNKYNLIKPIYYKKGMYAYNAWNNIFTKVGQEINFADIKKMVINVFYL